MYSDNITSVMHRHGHYRVPPIGVLVAFESASRHRSFSRAAQELGTFQPAISRQVAALEKLVSSRLFERSPSGVTLTEAGSRLREAIAAGLGAIHQGIAEVEELSRDEQVVIACSQKASQFVLLPRFDALWAMLGEHVQIRILTDYQSTRHLLHDSVADVVFAWSDTQAASDHCVPVLREAVRPVCSPAYAAQHADVLEGPVAGWNALALIEYTWTNEGWATWDDWFAAAGSAKRAKRRRPHYLGLESYAYVLEAAAAGRGMALGWRGFIEQHLTTGALVAIGEGYVEFDNHFFCSLTEKGRGKPLAHTCLAYFTDALGPVGPE